MAKLSEMKLGVSTMLSWSKFKYSLSQAKKNVIRNGLMSVASLVTIIACLCILGLFTVVTLNVNAFTAQSKDQCEIQLFMLQDTSDERIAEIGDEILKNQNVKAISLYTRKELYEYAMNDVFEGRQELIGDYNEEDNPFSDSYKIVLHDIEKTSQTVEELSAVSGVEHIENIQDIANIVIMISDAIQKLSIVIMLVLLLISVVIISNTVRLTVFNRRKEISIMKYIGATDRFIRMPFIIEAMLIGLFGAITAFGIISWGYIALFDSYSKSEFMPFDLVSYLELAPFLGILFVVFGCLIGIIGSVISMRKYLKA